MVGGGVGKVISKQPTNRSAERGRRTGDPEKGAGREETHLPQERRKELSKPSEYSLPLDVHEQPLDHGNLICSNTLFLLSRFKWTQQARRKRNQTEDPGEREIRQRIFSSFPPNDPRWGGGKSLHLLCFPFSSVNWGPNAFCPELLCGFREGTVTAGVLFNPS